MKAIGSNLHTLAFQNDCMYILLDSEKFIWEDIMHKLTVYMAYTCLNLSSVSHCYTVGSISM